MNKKKISILCAIMAFFSFGTASIVVNGENQYSPLEVQYTCENNNPCDAKGCLTFKPSSSSDITSYSIFWANDDGLLENYTPLTSFESGETEYEYNLPDGTYIPDDSTKLAVLSYIGTNKMGEAFTTINNTVDKGKKLYEFQVISDTHIRNKDSLDLHYVRTKEALSQIKSISSSTSGIFFVGDMTDSGYEIEYQKLFEIIDGVYEERPNLYFTIGNHESIKGQPYDEVIELFQQFTYNQKTYYSFSMHGAKFIMLGSIKASVDVNIGCELGEEQITWLKNELSTTSEKNPVFIFLHQPLKDTVSGSLTKLSQKWYGLNDKEDAEMREILKDYPNACMFTGHTHWHLESEQAMLYGNGTDANFFNTASVGYLWQGSGDGSSYDGSQGLFIEIYTNCIVVKGREFENKKWISAAQFVIPIQSETNEVDNNTKTEKSCKSGINGEISTTISLLLLATTFIISSKKNKKI